MSEGSDPNEETYVDASPFQPKQKAPLLERAVPVSQELPAYGGGYPGGTCSRGLRSPRWPFRRRWRTPSWPGCHRSTASTRCSFGGRLRPARLLAPARHRTGGSISALVAAAVLPLAVAGSAEAVELAGALAILVGGCFLAARALRLGWLADYFSRPVLIGYLHGVAVVLVVSQLGKLLGLEIDARDPLLQLGEVVRELGETSGLTLAVGVAALAVLIPLRYVAPRFPAALLVVVGAIGAPGGSTSTPRRRGARERPERHPGPRDPDPGAAATRCSFCLPRSGSSSSASPTRSSPRDRSPASTTSTCGRSRRCSRWERPTWRPG